MPTSVQLLIVDQDPDVRFGVRKLLADSSAVAVAGEAPFGTEAVAQALALSPDVILCGLEEPLVRPLETIEALTRALPQTPLIAYSTTAEIAVARRAMLAGARDFLVRPLDRDTLIEATQHALDREEQRELGRAAGRRPLGARATVLTVFSAKGGVGKTTFATNLAAALAHHVGQSTVIVDADTSFGDVLVNMDLQATTDVLQLLRDLAADPQADPARFLVQHVSGARVLAGPANPLTWSTVDAQAFTTVVDTLARTHDYVIIDLAAVASPVTLAALDAASLVLWLVTPQVASIRDNMQALHVLEQAGLSRDKVRFIANHPTAHDDVPIASIAAAMQGEIYWTIPYDTALYRQSQLGRTVEQYSGSSAAADAITALARAIAGMPVGSRGRARRWPRLRPQRARVGAAS